MTKMIMKVTSNKSAKFLQFKIIKKSTENKANPLCQSLIRVSTVSKILLNSRNNLLKVKTNPLMSLQTISQLKKCFPTTQDIHKLKNLKEPMNKKT
jgi:hypothetical protein